MKKRRQKTIDGNVVLFPGLEKRLLEKALQYLQNHQYIEAVELFEEMKLLTPDNPDVYTGLVLAYYESSSLQQAKQLSHAMLKEGIGDYFTSLDLYLMILMQLHDYEEIIYEIEYAFDEKEIPSEKLESLSKLLAFSKRMAKENSNKKVKEKAVRVQETSDYSPLHLKQEKDINKLLFRLADLSHQNIRPYIEEITTYLKDKEGHPFLKTMLVNILREQEYVHPVQLEKFGWEKTVCPTELASVEEDEQMRSIEVILEKMLEHDDPIVLQQVISLLKRLLMLTYPFELEPPHPSIWAAAFHSIIFEYNGIIINLNDLADMYEINEETIADARTMIRKLEEISFPIV